MVVLSVSMVSFSSMQLTTIVYCLSNLNLLYVYTVLVFASFDSYLPFKSFVVSNTNNWIVFLLNKSISFFVKHPWTAENQKLPWTFLIILRRYSNRIIHTQLTFSRVNLTFTFFVGFHHIFICIARNPCIIRNNCGRKSK